jgi:Trp operon repressor
MINEQQTQEQQKLYFHNTHLSANERAISRARDTNELIKGNLKKREKEKEGSKGIAINNYYKVIFICSRV